MVEVTVTFSLDLYKNAVRDCHYFPNCYKYSRGYCHYFPTSTTRMNDGGNYKTSYFCYDNGGGKNLGYIQSE